MAMLALSLLLSFSACKDKQTEITPEPETSPEEVQEEIQTPKEPVIISLAGGDYGYPSPYLHYSRGPGSFKMQLVFDSLLERGEKGTIPWLAESYSVSEDGLTYSFKIREGVKWHDGKDMTPEDVKFSFEYQMENPPVSGISTTLGKGDNIIESMSLDGNDFIVKVSQKNAAMLENLGSVRIIPKHIWENIDNPKEFTDEICGIGCGPYKITDYDKEQGAYKFEAFKDYWGQNHLVDEIRFVPVSDGILAFDKGEIDLTGITPDVYEKYA
ncbi:MAG: diguanylate phosphodiesterase, partial [Clostridiales bacterium]|nr:diguanylate phosphodiesterase [Clostridiales bacterium]